MPTEAARENFDTFFVKPSVALGGLVSDWFACGATRKDGKPNVSEEAMDEGVTIDLDDLANQPMTPELAQTKVETPNGLQFGASSDEITPNGGIKLPSAQIGDEIGAEVSAENSAAAANTIASALAQALPKETPSATPQATPPTTPVKPATPPPPPKPKVVCPDKRASKAIPPPDPDPPLSAFAGSWKKEIGEGGHAAFVQEMGVPWLIARTFAGSPPNNHFRVVDGHLEMSNKSDKPKDFGSYKPGNLVVTHELKGKPMQTVTTYEDGVLSRQFTMDGTVWTVRHWTSKGRMVEECFYKNKDIYYVFTWTRVK